MFFIKNDTTSEEGSLARRSARVSFPHVGGTSFFGFTNREREPFIAARIDQEAKPLAQPCGRQELLLLK